jgi:hypothetical protein
MYRPSGLILKDLTSPKVGMAPLNLTFMAAFNGQATSMITVIRKDWTRHRRNPLSEPIISTPFHYKKKPFPKRKVLPILITPSNNSIKGTRGTGMVNSWKRI